jgi:hypothetical protein
MMAIVEIGTNLQTAIVAVGAIWAIAFVLYTAIKYLDRF